MLIKIIIYCQVFLYILMPYSTLFPAWSVDEEKVDGAHLGLGLHITNPYQQISDQDIFKQKVPCLWDIALEATVKSLDVKTSIERAAIFKTYGLNENIFQELHKEFSERDEKINFAKYTLQNIVSANLMGLGDILSKLPLSTAQALLLQARPTDRSEENLRKSNKIKKKVMHLLLAEKASQQRNILDLPKEIIERILFFIPVGQTSGAHQSCSFFHTLLESEIYWKEWCERNRLGKNPFQSYKDAAVGHFFWQKANKTPILNKGLIDKAVHHNDQAAAKAKIRGLKKGANGYQQNDQELQNFLHEEYQKGNAFAIHIFLKFIEKGVRFFSIYRPESRTIYLQQCIASLGPYIASLGPYVERKLQYPTQIDKETGYTIGHIYYIKAMEIYKKNNIEYSVGKEFLEKAANFNYSPAIHDFIDALMDGKMGFKQDETLLRSFLEQSLEKNENPYVLKKVIEGFLEGRFGFPRNAEALHDLLHKKSLEGHPFAICQTALGLEKGINGFKKNLGQLTNFLNSMCARHTFDYVYYKSLNRFPETHLLAMEFWDSWMRGRAHLALYRPV